MSVLPSGPEWTPSSSVNTADVGFFVFFQNAANDHTSFLLKQKEDIGYLSRHLDHVISFVKLATARNQGMAFLHCKRLVRLPIIYPLILTQPCHKAGAYGSEAWWHNLKIINILPSVADCVSDGKPPTGKVQHIYCATEHRTLSGSNLFHYWLGYETVSVLLKPRLNPL